MKGKGTAVALAPKEKSKNKAKVDQMIVILDGEAKIIASKEESKLTKNESIFIAKNSEYEIENTSNEILVFVVIEGKKEEVSGIGG
jgi:mannose-6-phosphate isomerase-like protein (cupin superfamily)